MTTLTRPSDGNEDFSGGGGDGKGLGQQIQAAALALAGSGVRVFPVHGVRRVAVPEGFENRCSCGDAACPNPGKHPVGLLVPNGHNGATTEIGQVARWFEIGRAHV